MVTTPSATAPRRISRRTVLRTAAACATLSAGLPAHAAAASATSPALALHVLNRITYGPGGDDLPHIVETGIDAFIAAQLQPQQLQQPTALTDRLAQWPTLRATQAELADRYAQAQAAGRDGSDAGRQQRKLLLRQPGQEAAQARLLRALHSPRQLEEVMVDFWFNHFNIFAGKGMDQVLVGSYEAEAIRPHALGRFRDLLGATAHHPAMLFYLDNWLSVVPGFRPHRHLQERQHPAGGLNENYARELMELHTLGVDGGYSQRDVTELARIFTGWTFHPRARALGPTLFTFDAARHDPDTKHWLGQVFGSAGHAEGERALDVLAAHNATARHVCGKLARCFVADTPPPALVQRLAQRFTQTDGDIRAVLHELFSSSEFRAPVQHGVRFKTPYRYIVSALRAAQVPVRDLRPLLSQLTQLGMPLYGCATPDGYPDTQTAWLSPDAMARRIQFATTLGAGRMPLLRPPEVPEHPAQPDEGSSTRDAPVPRNDPAWLPGPIDPAQLLATLAPGISTHTREVVAQAQPGLRAALLLGSPDFMRY